MRLRDKVTLVTGGGQGIGRAYCLRFAQEGAAVGVLDLREDEAGAVAREIEAGGGRAIALGADVTDEASVGAATKKLVDRFGRIDVLVNNAAIYADLDVSDTSLPYLRKVFEVNVVGAIICARAVFPTMKKQLSGSIINVTSIGAYMFVAPGPPGPEPETAPVPAYGLSKSGVIYATKAMAGGLGRYNIRVNAIAPGLTLSEATRKHKGIGDGPIPEWLVQDTAMRKVLEPEDLTGLATFLASDESALMTGQTLVMDAGRIMLG